VQNLLRAGLDRALAADVDLDDVQRQALPAGDLLKLAGGRRVAVAQGAASTRTRRTRGAPASVR
jgi:hypothetical protein